MRAVSLLHLLLLLPATGVESRNSPGDRRIELNTEVGPGIPLSPRAGPANQTEEPLVVHRCRAEEYTPGTALNVIVLLAMACAVHMPGSLTAPRKAGLYRLAPELGIWDAMLLLLLLGKGRFLYGRSLKVSATSALMLRHFNAPGDRWWRREGRSPGDEDEAQEARRSLQCAEGFLHRVQRYGNGRLIGGTLALCAVIKAFAAKGTLKTILLAASYALSFFTIEVVSLVALRSGPPPTLAEHEHEALGYAELVTLLGNDADAWSSSTHPHWQTADKHRNLREAFKIGVCGVYGVAAALQVLFPPFSVPIFLLLEFEVAHSANGKWTFYYLTSLAWLFWILVAVSALCLLVYLSALVVSRGDGEKREQYVAACKARVTGLLVSDEDWLYLDLYSVLKFALILRFYIWGYTGQGTTKYDWLEWLG